MWWIFLSILSGLGDSFIFAFMKKLKGLDPLLIVFSQFFFALPFMVMFLLTQGIPEISPKFYFIVCFMGSLIVFTSYLLVKGTQSSNLSKSVPMLSFTPIFLLLTSFIMLGEFPSRIGLIGILLVVIGAYVININSGKNDFFEPFRNIMNEKGALMVLLVAFIWSITANFSKMGVLASSPAFFITCVYAFNSLLLLPFAIIKFNKNKQIIKKNFKYMIFIGLSAAFMSITIHIAVIGSIVPYVVSLKRSSVVFSVIIGYIFFKEKNFKQSLIGASIMLVGVVLISLF